MPEDGYDLDHLIPKAKDEIQFIHASDQAKFMEGETLQDNQGVTFELFAPEEKKKGQEEGKDALPKHIFVPEVVREPKIHFYQVPRLGSYMAIKLEYESCLFDEAFDAAAENFAKINEQRATLANDKKEWQDAQAEKEQEALENGEEFVPENKKWPEYNYAPLKTKKVQFVVCLNTMG